MQYDHESVYRAKSPTRWAEKVGTRAALRAQNPNQGSAKQANLAYAVEALASAAGAIVA